MPTDPWLGATALGISDPVESIVAGLSARVAALEARIRTLETTATVQVGAGAPTAATRDGTLYVDTTNSRLYARSSGSWKFVAIA
jgi:hypothetical protein